MCHTHPCIGRSLGPFSIDERVEMARGASARSNATTAVLFDATRTCLENEGPEVSIHRIAEVSGVSVGGIYYHYPSRSALLAATGVDCFARFAAWAHSELDNVDDPALRVSIFGRRFTRMPDTHHSYAVTIWHTQRFIWGDEYRSSEEGYLETDVREGIERGQFAADLVPARISAAIGMMLHFLSLRLLNPRLPAKDGDDLVEVALIALGTDAESARDLAHRRLPRRPAL